MKGVTDTDNTHAKRVCKDFKMKNLGEYHDLFVEIVTLLFQNFQKLCFEVFELDPARFLTAPTLAWQAAFKRPN